MKDFSIKVSVTTIAMYANFGDGYKWSIDTYVRTNPTKNFIENFMNDYAGNGIEKVRIVEEWKNEYYIENLNSFSTMIKHLRENFENLNETILNY